MRGARGSCATLARLDGASTRRRRRAQRDGRGRDRAAREEDGASVAAGRRRAGCWRNPLPPVGLTGLVPFLPTLEPLRARGAYYLNVTAITGAGAYMLTAASDDRDGDGLADGRDNSPTNGNPGRADWDRWRSCTAPVTAAVPARRRAQGRPQGRPGSARIRFRLRPGLYRVGALLRAGGYPPARSRAVRINVR